MVVLVGGCVCVRGGEEEREEQVFCVYSHRVAARNFRPHKRFTFVIFADPVPCKRLMSEMMNQNKPISQSLTQTDSQGGRRAARQTLFSEQNQTQILSGQISLSLFPFFFLFFCFFLSGHSAAACCPLLSVSWLRWTVVLIGAFKGLQRKNLVVKLTIREQFKCWTHFLLSDHLTC